LEACEKEGRCTKLIRKELDEQNRRCEKILNDYVREEIDEGSENEEDSKDGNRKEIWRMRK